MDDYSKRVRDFCTYLSIYIFILLAVMVWQTNGIPGKPAPAAIKETSPPAQEVIPIQPPRDADKNRKYSWYYTGNKEHKPVRIHPDFARLIQEYQGFFQGYSSELALYLTFDEGYENGYTPGILDVLKEEKVPAAFFITGSYLKKNLNLVRRMLDEGHLVANHTFHHYSLPLLTPEQVEKEITALAADYKELLGRDMAPFVRPPMGEFSPQSLWVTARLQYHTVFWSFAYRDWETNRQKGKGFAYKQVMENHHPGAILLMHAVSRDNAEALGEIIRDLKKEGYEFLPLTELINKREKES